MKIFIDYNHFPSGNRQTRISQDGVKTPNLNLAQFRMSNYELSHTLAY